MLTSRRTSILRSPGRPREQCLPRITTLFGAGSLRATGRAISRRVTW
ncbi:hypothetical protein IEO21_09454 [Rhodonia placenta]|uniref:Uncharacterized protein n=1 Tax=Rhodonia placenta TaxID=104341 RepID=A0A8H7NUA8_9APHY|nr:hypothetical protein IEO21_09454 [Postia placenta]